MLTFCDVMLVDTDIQDPHPRSDRLVDLGWTPQANKSDSLSQAHSKQLGLH